MKWSLPLGRVAGIQLSMHVTFFLLVVLFVVAEAQPGGLGLFAGLVWLTLIFACVLLQELAHSVLARAKGAEVGAIVLLPIGGVSQIERMPERWSDELAIAAAGPLASLGLGVLAGVAAAVTGARLWPINLCGGGLLPRLAWLNLLLGLFNLLPAFPLDGAGCCGPRWSATTPSRRPPARRPGSGGPWQWPWRSWGCSGTSGWPSSAPSCSSPQPKKSGRSPYHQRLRGTRVRDLMRSGVTSIDTHQPAGLAAGWWAGPQVVTLDGRYYGYYGLADGAARQAAGPGRTVGEFADREAPTLSPSEDLPPVRVGRTGQLGLPGPGRGRWRDCGRCADRR